MTNSPPHRSRVALIPTALLAAALLAPAQAAAAPPTITSTAASGITATTATLQAEVDPQGKATRYRFEYGPADCAANPCTSVPVPEGQIPGSATGPQPVSVQIEGLTPHTTYHLRVVATHNKEAGGEVKGPDTPFAPFAEPQVFDEPCPNDSLRTGLASAALPDCRAYEQATPIDKGAGDAIADIFYTRSSPAGDAISYLSFSGMPGAKGAQDFPPYLSSRGPGGWSAHGLLPPASFGQQAEVLGWAPDFSSVFTKATALGEPPATAMLAAAPGQEPSAIAPYLADLNPNFASSSADGSQVLFESKVAIPGVPGALAGKSNLYLWERESATLHLAGAMNDGSAPSRGAFAGPYKWIDGTTPASLSEEGGASGRHYLQDPNAISADGRTVFFTAAGSGQLYERLNPAQPQSALDGEGKCTEPAKACTIRTSASQRTVPDPAGDRPAAFMAASTDGSKVLFTSSQMLTDEADTGPEQSAAAIQRAEAADGTNPLASVVATHASGIAADSEHLYWIDPATGAIGRSKLDGSEVKADFIAATDNPKGLTVSSGFIYWANAGKEEGEGTIGKAKLNGEAPASEVDQDFVAQAGNPKGVAVGGEYVYWTNDHLAGEQGRGEIGRAQADDGSEADEEFFVVPGISTGDLSGIAVDGEHVYWVGAIPLSDVNRRIQISRIKLDGSDYIFEFINLGLNVAPRDLATDATHLYWAEQASERIGRAKLNGEGAASEVEQGFITEADNPIGLALEGPHLYWSSNGESSPNPGNQLYRFDRESGALSALAPDSSSQDGIDVKGILGASADASAVYFAANGVPDGVTGSPNARGEVAEAGDCKGILKIAATGVCNLYLAEGGEVRFIARLDSGAGLAADGANWTPKVQTQGSGGVTREPRSARVSADGEALLFRSQRQLTDYPTQGEPTFYLYQADTGALRCVSCSPTLDGGGGKLGSIATPFVGPFPPTSTLSHNLSADGKRVFFETKKALVLADTNGEAGCPVVGSALQKFPACTDVYEWEAVGSGSCDAEHENADGGCIYLVSTGKGSEPQLLADASTDGSNVFFFTRSQLVGQDKDQLLDVYDARVGGGLTAQYPTTDETCQSAEACHGPPGAVPPVPAPPHLSGPGNPPRKACPKGKRRAGKRCVKKNRKHRKHERGAARR